MKNIKVRRFLVLLLCVAMAFTMLPQEMVSAVEVGRYGDANRDGVVDLRDVLLLERYLAGEAVSPNLGNCDLNIDGKLDWTDVDAIRDYLVGNRPSLTPQLCTIYLDNQGGEGVNAITAAKGFPLGTPLPSPSLEGKYFDGWVDKNGNAFDTAQTLTGDVQLYATYGDIPSREIRFIDSYTETDILPEAVFTLSGGSSKEQVRSGISLVVKDGSQPLTLLVGESDGLYTVGAVGGFRPGGSYELTLVDDSLRFQGKEAEIRTVTFTVYKEEYDRLAYAHDLIFIQDTPAMTYDVKDVGDDLDMLEALIPVNDSIEGPLRGSFVYSGRLEAGDFVCIYQGVHPENRNYADPNMDYTDQAVAYIQITRATADGYEFTGLETEDLSEVLLLPDSIPYSLADKSALPTTDGTISADDYDKAARTFLGLTAEPEFNEGDFLVFYVGELNTADAAVYGRVTALNGDVVSFELIEKADIESFSGMYVEQPVNTGQLLTEEEQGTLLQRVETQALNSGFAEEATKSMILSAMETGEVESRLRADGFSEDEIRQVTADVGLLAAAIPLDGDTSGAGGGAVGSGVNAATKKPTVTVGKPKVTANFIGDDESRWGNGVGVALDVHVVLNIDRLAADGKTTNSLKIDLGAGFEQQVHFDMGVEVDVVWGWRLFIPVIDDVYCGVNVDIKNYSFAYVSARLYTLSTTKAYTLWEEIEQETGDADLQRLLHELDKLGVLARQEDPAGPDTAAYQAKLAELANQYPGYVANQAELGMTDVGATFEQVLRADSKEANRVSIDSLMVKYGEMLESKCDWITLLDQQVFEVDLKFKLVAVTLKLDLVIRAKANVTIGADVEYEVGKRYTFWLWLLSADAGDNQMDLLDEHFGFQFYVMGNLGLRMGLRASIDIGFLDTWVASVGGSVEFGPYLELWGYFFYIYDRERPANTETWNETEEMQGALYVEFGLYLIVKFKAQALGGTVTYEPTLLDTTFPLLTAGEQENVYDFAYHPPADAPLRIRDADMKQENGIQMSVPDGYLRMKVMDLCSGDLLQKVFAPEYFSFQITSGQFTVDQHGVVTAKNTERDRYLTGSLRVVWKASKLSFSKYDVDITIPLLWTNMSSDEVDERFDVSVNVGNTLDGYKTVWSNIVSRLDEFDLPSPELVLAGIGYSTYNYLDGAGNTVNLRYGGTGAYTAAQTTDIRLVQNTAFYYDIYQRPYTLIIQGVQQADGSTEEMRFTTTYGQRFDYLDALAKTGTRSAETYTRFLNISRTVDGTQQIFDPNSRADLGFYLQNNSFTATYTANYVDDSLTATYVFVGLDPNKSQVETKVIFQRGQRPVLDVNAFIAAYIQQHEIQLPYGYAVVVASMPEVVKAESNVRYLVECESSSAAIRRLSFDSNGGSAVAGQNVPEGLAAQRPADPTLAGHTFLDWYQDPECTQLYDFSTPMSDRDVTLYAKWKAEAYRVTRQSLGETYDSFSIDNGAAYGDKLSDPVYAPGHSLALRAADYIFEGWYTNREYSGAPLSATSIFTGTDNATVLYAKWTQKPDITALVAEYVDYTPQSYTFAEDTEHAFVYQVKDGTGYSTENAEIISYEDLKAVIQGLTISYSNDSKFFDNEWSTDLPSNAGGYIVKLKQPVSERYRAIEVTLNGKDTNGDSVVETPIYIARAEITLTGLGAYMLGLAVAIRQPQAVVVNQDEPQAIPGDGLVSYECTSVATGPVSISSDVPFISLPEMVSNWRVRAVVAESANYEEATSDWLLIPGLSAYQAGFYPYVTIHTADAEGAGTDSDISAYLYDRDGKGFTYMDLGMAGYDDFERDDTDTYLLSETAISPWHISSMAVVKDIASTENGPNWFADTIRLAVSKTKEDVIENGEALPAFVGDSITKNPTLWLEAGENAKDRYTLVASGAFNRIISATGGFISGGSDAINLTEGVEPYLYSYDGQISDQYYPNGYNSFYYYDPPILSVSCGQPELDRYVYNTGVGSFEIDTAGLRTYMLKNNLTESFTYTVTLDFPAASTKGTHSFTRSILVTPSLPVPTPSPALLLATSWLSEQEQSEPGLEQQWVQQPPDRLSPATSETRQPLAMELSALPVAGSIGRAWMVNSGSARWLELATEKQSPCLSLGHRVATTGGFQLPVLVSGTLPLWGLLGEISYDATALKLTGYELNGSIFPVNENALRQPFTLRHDLTAQPWRFLATNTDLANLDAKSGLVLTLLFETKPGITERQPISVDLIQAVDLAGDVLENNRWDNDRYDHQDNKDGEPSAPSIPPVPEQPSPFEDVRESDWFYEDVLFVQERGLMSGTAATLFSPGLTTTRAMVATILWRLEGSPDPTGDSGFTDVAQNFWYTAGVTWAAQNGVVNGYGNGLFGPDDPVTREQLATMLHRYVQFKGGSLSGSATLSAYLDQALISAYAREPMSWAVAGGLLQGQGDGTLAPQSPATRAQLAAILHRLLLNQEQLLPAK